MPVYDYQCQACGERFEVTSSLADREAKAVCPACGSREVERRYGSVSVGIRRTRVNPGTFVHETGRKTRHVEPPKP